MNLDPFQLEQQRLAIRHILLKATFNLTYHGAILDPKGDLIDAVGNNPLHYPGLEATVKATKPYLTPKRGEVIITNDPHSGNMRLCDLVLISGAYGSEGLKYYVAVQLSFPQLLTLDEKFYSSVEQEGFRIPPTLLEQGNAINPHIIEYLAQSRLDREILVSRLEQGMKAAKKAAVQIIELDQKWGGSFGKGLEALNLYSEKMMRTALHNIPDGEYSYADVLESDGLGAKNIKIQCRLSVQGEHILVSFLGTNKQTRGTGNATYAMTLGACFWVLRSLVRETIPVNSGAFKAFSVEAPEGTLVNAKSPSPLLGGYYETSKKIVEILYLLLNKALPGEIPAPSGATSNTFIFKDGQGRVLAEVLGTGSGASKAGTGTSACLTELHNSPLLSIEEIEKRYSIQITHFAPRVGSGGDGKNVGGDGITRGYKFLAPGLLASLSDRRHSKAKGLFGGSTGLSSEFILVRNGERKILDDKQVLKINVGDILIVNTAGGGGWGKKEEAEG